MLELNMDDSETSEFKRNVINELSRTLIFHM